MSSKEIIVKQLPVIEEQLQTIKAEITQRTDEAMSFVCTEDTVKEIKKIRAELNNEFKQWEEKRKEVKNAVLSPYDAFEAVYKDCITDVYKKADADLKSKIDSVEGELKAKKRAEVEAYFNEYLKSNEIDFVTFERANINITLSASLKSLKEKATEFIDRICGDCALIESQEYSDEIMYEYKQSLNVSEAIMKVANRHRAIEEEKAREAEKQAREQEKEAAEGKVQEVTENQPETVLAPPKEVEQILTTRFTVRATRTQLKALKEFLEVNGYDYE